MNIYEAIKSRRTYYYIGKTKTISNDRVLEIVKHCYTHAPSAINIQTSKSIVLFDGEHDALWEIAREELRKVVPAASFASTDEKITSFKNGFATILFFEDADKLAEAQNQLPLYKDNFIAWSQQSMGMLQNMIWTCLEADGLGVSLQHYAPLIDEAVAKRWNVPKTWKLIAQMPLGNRVAPPDNKQVINVNEYVLVK